MSPPKGFKIATYGGEVEEVQNAAGNPLFKSVDLTWSKPIDWHRGKSSPTRRSDACLYILSHSHGSYSEIDRIQYVGLSTNPSRRFINHPTAHAILKSPGRTTVSFSFFDFVRGRNRIERVKRALEEIEHLLIWALWDVADLKNDRKMFTLPGMGSKGGGAWHITNRGHRFNGRMPIEIVHPWMLVRSGRDRSIKA